MGAPKFNPQISLGNIITVASLVFVAGGAWYGMQFQAEYTEKAIASINATISDRRAAVDQRVAGHEVRIRDLENNATRSDERMSNILQLLARIDGRLARIEERN